MEEDLEEEIIIAMSDFDNDFVLEGNHINVRTALNGTVFECTTEEENYIRAITMNPDKTRKVWTIVNADTFYYYRSGYHPDIAFGFLVTKETVDEGIQLVVMPDDCLIRLR
jgi:hypothetical protein